MINKKNFKKLFNIQLSKWTLMNHVSTSICLLASATEPVWHQDPATNGETGENGEACGTGKWWTDHGTRPIFFWDRDVIGWNFKGNISLKNIPCKMKKMEQFGNIWKIPWLIMKILYCQRWVSFDDNYSGFEDAGRSCRYVLMILPHSIYSYPIPSPWNQ